MNKSNWRSQKRLLIFLRNCEFLSEISWPSRNLYSKCVHNIYADQLLSCAVQWSLCQAKLALLLEYSSKSKMTFAVQKSASIRILLLGLDTSNSDFKYQSKIFLNPIKVVNSHSLILNKFGKSVDRFWHADKDQTNWPKKALKISKFQKQIFLFLFEPKNEWNLFLNSALASKTSQINQQFN